MECPKELKDLYLFQQETLWKKWPALLVEWQRDFPKINITEQARKAHRYILAKGRIIKHHAAFLNNWMDKADKFRLDEERRKPAMTNSQEKAYFARRQREKAEACERQRLVTLDAENKEEELMGKEIQKIAKEWRSNTGKAEYYKKQIKCLLEENRGKISRGLYETAHKLIGDTQ